MDTTSSIQNFYFRVWRWHFFAGLCVIPIAICLAISGAIYLFNADFNAYIENQINGEITAPQNANALTADVLLSQTLAKHDGAKLRKYVLQKNSTDPTAEIELQQKNGQRLYLWINRYDGTIVHTVGSNDRFMRLVKKFHGEFLTGQYGTIIVELAASWMIIIIITGLYLYWPRQTSWQTTLLPRLMQDGRLQLKKLHGVIGIFASVFVLIFLVSGLPWTSVWGTGFKYVQEKTGTAGPGQEFRVTLQSSPPPPNATAISITDIVKKIEPENLPNPVHIRPPRGQNGVWTIRSMIQDRPKRVTLHYDQWTGNEIMRITFSDYPNLKKAVSLGIAFHEGHLFGRWNQALGVLIALCVVALSISGLLLAWRKRPKHESSFFKAPPLPQDHALTKGIVLIIFILAVLLPLVGLSLVIVWSAEKIISYFYQKPLTHKAS